jgi:DNA polymerase elongation subunit (family B)
MKGFIVYADYDYIDDQTIVKLFGRLENGQSFVTINKVTPYFFIKEKDEKKVSEVLKKFNVEKTNLKTFKDEKVIKISHKSQTEINKLLIQINNLDGKHATLHLCATLLRDVHKRNRCQIIYNVVAIIGTRLNCKNRCEQLNLHQFVIDYMWYEQILPFQIAYAMRFEKKRKRKAFFKKITKLPDNTKNKLYQYASLLLKNDNLIKQFSFLIQDYVNTMTL